MIPVLAEAVRNTNSAAERIRITDFQERGDRVVELDQMKYTLNTYKQPLLEVGDSL